MRSLLLSSLFAFRPPSPSDSALCSFHPSRLVIEEPYSVLSPLLALSHDSLLSLPPKSDLPHEEGALVRRTLNDLLEKKGALVHQTLNDRQLDEGEVKCKVDDTLDNLKKLVDS